MNSTTFIEFAVNEENAGTVSFYLEGISPLDIALSHFTIADVKMAGDTVNIGGSDKKSGPGQPVTAEPRAIIAEHPMAGGLAVFLH